jgi:outer membrane protein OmpA-like peptidoglycan-associated protein
MVLDEAIRADASFFEAHMLKSQIYEKGKDWKLSQQALIQAFHAHPQKRQQWLESLVRVSFRSGSYNEAFEALQEGNQIDGWSMKDELLAQSVLYARESFNDPIEINPAALQGNVNSKAPEYYPALFASDDRMIFTREVDYPGKSFGQEDFYEAELRGDSWLTVRSLGEINTFRNEGAPSIRGDGRILVFAACAGIDGSYGNREGVGSCDLFQSVYDVKSAQYQEASNLRQLNSSSWESQPALSADGQSLFFVRAFRSKQTNELVQDIFLSEKDELGEWKKAIRLPDVINSEGTEENPFLHSDGESLYFASDGLPGMGGMDLFVSRKQADGSWSIPENLGYPINTSGDENSLQVFTDGRKAMFATDRENPGDLDLWEFELPEAVSANAVALWTGAVFESDTRRPVEAKVQVLNAAGTLLSTQRSNQDDGQFTLSFSSDENVIIQVEHPEFAFFSTTLTGGGDLDPFVSIALDRLEVGMTMTLRDVRFEKSSANLENSFQPELEQLAKTMLQSEIRIRIIGHTDSDGTLEDNLKLSGQRAESVAHFLEDRGISRSRMELIGLGASVPIGSNQTDEGKALNRRTEVVVIN